MFNSKEIEMNELKQPITATKPLSTAD